MMMAAEAAPYRPGFLCVLALAADPSRPSSARPPVAAFGQGLGTETKRCSLRLVGPWRSGAFHAFCPAFQ
jgi:hypothetical protein